MSAPMAPPPPEAPPAPPTTAPPPAPPMAPPPPPGGARRSRPEDAATHITVSDPVQHSEGMNKYTSYRVDVRPPANVGGGGDSNGNNDIFQHAGYSAVLRRYSDFLWLYERLHKERGGSIVPPLPEKQAVARFSAAFVEDRRRQLERFLRRVSVHPELHDAPSLDTFLRADDVVFQAAKNAKSSSSGGGGADGSMYMSMSNPTASFNPPKKDGIKRWFADAKTSVSGNLVRSPDDDLFDEIERYVHALDHQMKSVCHMASGLVRKGKEIANGMFEFGLAFNLLGQSEADALGVALGKVGETADTLSVLSAEQAERELRSFEEPLQDYLKTIHAVRLALYRRHEKRLRYTTCLHEVEVKEANLNKLRMQMGMEGKAYAAEMSLNRGRAAADAARDDFAAVSQRVLREVDRFKREKADDMRATVLEYIRLQIEYNRRMEEVWAALVPQLERVSLDGGNGGGGGGGTNVGAEGRVPVHAGAMPSQPPPPPPVPQHQPAPYATGAMDPSGMMNVQYRDPMPGM